MKRDYIKGTTTEDRFRSINRIFQYVFPRLGKKITCAIPPVPILIECGKGDEKGLLCEKLIPISGIITKVFVRIKNLKGEVQFALVISNELGSNTFKFSTKKSLIIEEVNYAITEGSLLTLYTDSHEAFSNVYLSALINMQLKDVNKELLLEDTKSEEEIIEEINNTEGVNE